MSTVVGLETDNETSSNVIIEDNNNDIERGYMKQKQHDSVIANTNLVSRKVQQKNTTDPADDVVKLRPNTTTRCNSTNRRPGRVSFSFFFALVASIWFLAVAHGMFDGIVVSVSSLFKNCHTSSSSSNNNKKNSNTVVATNTKTKEEWVPLRKGKDGKIYGYILKDAEKEIATTITTTTTTTKETKQEWKPLMKANDTKIIGYVLEEESIKPDVAAKYIQEYEQEDTITSTNDKDDDDDDDDDDNFDDDDYDDDDFDVEDSDGDNMVGYVLKQYIQSLQNASSIYYKEDSK